MRANCRRCRLHRRDNNRRTITTRKKSKGIERTGSTNLMKHTLALPRIATFSAFALAVTVAFNPLSAQERAPSAVAKGTKTAEAPKVAGAPKVAEAPKCAVQPDITHF